MNYTDYTNFLIRNLYGLQAFQIRTARNLGCGQKAKRSTENNFLYFESELLADRRPLLLSSIRAIRVIRATCLPAGRFEAKKSERSEASNSCCEVLSEAKGLRIYNQENKSKKIYKQYNSIYNIRSSTRQG